VKVIFVWADPFAAPNAGILDGGSVFAGHGDADGPGYSVAGGGEQAKGEEGELTPRFRVDWLFLRIQGW
jgi:hypothetical protein